jgi:hypothetical protein
MSRIDSAHSDGTDLSTVQGAGESFARLPCWLVRKDIEFSFRKIVNKKALFAKKPESERFGCPHSPESPLWEGFQANLFKPSNALLHGFQSRCSFYASAGVVFV